MGHERMTRFGSEEDSDREFQVFEGLKQIAAWVVFLLGGLLTVSVISLTLTNLERTHRMVDAYAFVVFTVIGVILMALGALYAKYSRTKMQRVAK